MAESQGWLAAYAARKGLKYEADADERWLRAWEPYVTLRTPIHYEHALLGTGATGSVTIARFVVDASDAAGAGGANGPASTPSAGLTRAAWIAIVQDLRLESASRAAATCDFVADATGQRRPRVFGDPLDLVTMPRRATGDPAFDQVFASFAASDADLAKAITPSLRKLTLSWRIPLHFEVRPGGFVLAPTTLGPDAQSLSWLLSAVQFFGEKAAKRVQ